MLRFVPVAQVIDLIYAELLDAPYVVDPAVLTDDRPVSFRFDRDQGDIRQFAAQFLASLGCRVDVRDGVSFVSKAKDAPEKRNVRTLVYMHRHRRADYLARLLQALLSARMTSDKPLAAPVGEKVSVPVPAASAAGQIDQSTDQLVLSDSADELQRARKVLAELYTATGEGVVRGRAYEVDGTDSANSGFSIAVKAFGGTVGVGSGSTDSDANAFKLSVPAVNLAIWSLRTVADMKDGEVIVLGGLIQDQTSTANDGQRFLPWFLDGHNRSRSRSEIVLVLQVQKI
ncbi:hypothetical protein [Paraburkholderia sp. MM5477-R1]|uniref:hypothetical protein n=1 Tax=Paraburkholderia sp. MM5477-R1 TaxID=2991062 RepID=UPI003D19E0EA